MSPAGVSYPFPVLGNGDDISGEFRASLEVTVGRQDVTLIVGDLVITNASVASLVETGQAACLIRLDCPRTYFRRAARISPPESTVRFPSSELEGRVQADFLVCAGRPIQDYSPVGLHSDYAGNGFSIKDGDVLAVGERSYFTVDLDFDPLTAPVSSIMRLCRGDFGTGPYRVQLEADKIEIHLSREDWDLYALVKNRSSRILAPTLAVPVLAHAIAAMRTRYEEYEGLKWVQRVTMILDAKHLSGDRSELEASQIILENPLHRGFEDLLSTMGGED